MIDTMFVGKLVTWIDTAASASKYVRQGSKLVRVAGTMVTHDTTVTKVTKTYFATADGRKWDRNGDEYGKRSAGLHQNRIMVK